jgi:hypothetical protein
MRQDHRASWRVCSLARAAPFAFCAYGRNTCSIVTRWERMAYDYHIMTYTPLEREATCKESFVEQTIFTYEKSNHTWFGTFRFRLDAGVLCQLA